MSNIQSLINDKSNLKNHNATDIDYIVESYLNSQISNAEMTQWLKAIFNHE